MIARLTLRGLAAHRLRLALTGLSIILSVGFVAATLMLSATLSASVTSAFAEVGVGTDSVVRTSRAVASDIGTDGPGRPVPASLLDRVRRVPGVQAVRGEVTGPAAVLDRQGEVVGDPPQTGTDWTDETELSPMTLQKGAGPTTPGQIAIDTYTAGTTGYRVGDRVRVVLPAGTQTFEVSGIFRFGSSDDLAGNAITAFEPVTARKLLLDEPETYQDILVHAESGVSQPEVTAAIAAVLPRGYEAVTGRTATEEKIESVKDIVRILQTFVLVFAGVAVFVGSFIIFNTFSMLVAQRIRELALLRAVGASRRQVTSMMLGEALVVGVVASTIGLGFGAGLGFVLLRLFSVLGFGLPAGELTFPVSAGFWGYAVGVLVTLLGAYLPARRAARIPPVAALRDDLATPAKSLRFRAILGGSLVAGGGIAMAAGFARTGTPALIISGGGALVLFFGITTISPIVSRPLTRALGWPFARLFGITGQMGRENAQRNPRRTAATASALMIGLTLISGASIISASMIASTNRQIDEGLTTDFRVSAPSSMSPISRPVDEALARVPGVATAVTSSTAPLLLDGSPARATAGDPAGLIRLYQLDLVSGSPRLPEDALLADQSTARQRDWRVGDLVPGRYQDGVTTDFRIAGIYRDVKTASATVPSLILGTGSYEEHYAGGRVDRIDVITTPSADPVATERALRSALSAWPTLELKDRAAIKAEYTESIDLLFQLVLVLLVLSIVIAALGIANTLALSVVERTREIGLLRAIGMQRRQVRRMIRYEAVVISTFGALLGLVVGSLLAWSIQTAAASDGMDVLSVPVGRLALCVLAAALIGVVAAFWPAIRATRLNVLRAISTME